jgi:two-component system response regulator RegA
MQARTLLSKAPSPSPPAHLTLALSPRAPRLGRVLIVDDDASAAARLAERLGSSGVAAAVTVSAALEDELAGAPPDLLVLEPNLPGRCWVSLLRGVLRHLPSGRVGIATAYPSNALRDHALALGCRFYVPKSTGPVRMTRALTAPPFTEYGNPHEVVTLARAEWEHLNRALVVCDGNMVQTARRLGIARPTLYRKLRKHPSPA